ncbi:hypothetical protein [Aeromonas hydrophila]|uniref:hypothetical protein n=1 Tax=Aeromonas hydrophila TaxID=644 RepID=UPI000332ABC0|nr:hypothetical protein [Aeromonas hydrophila]AGM44168.1 hypothetical protein AHML_11940 [Aeromonas hydrophila ML09-119]AHX32841.1 hypothetical protein V428_12325 [Aeromonas hydrophila subsp. hydrophila AL09-71]AHX69639.1 hypothetical protein V429_12340 [Aeromonas hydrophila pc104A]AJE38620.1 hypothetical protein V469_10735 [Aeromonas hydrophila J-1]AKJ37048.1 hypothetical protein U876_11145 [Aeromonas hydrophila NJ-35]
MITVKQMMKHISKATGISIDTGFRNENHSLHENGLAIIDEGHLVGISYQPLDGGKALSNHVVPSLELQTAIISQFLSAREELKVQADKIEADKLNDALITVVKDGQQ